MGMKGTLSYYYLILARRGPSESGKFQGVLEASSYCLPSCTRSLHVGWNAPVSEETVTQQMADGKSLVHALEWTVLPMALCSLYSSSLYVLLNEVL